MIGEIHGLAEARKRLLRTDGTWTPAERNALGEFLQQRIQVERQRRETGTWQEHLAAALDYRGWHRFVVERYQDGVWKRLTKKTHGTGSGGEKALALTIPQFAAAAAHYGSAGPTVPRLILLDEAFVGVDKRMRSHCMALLTAFQLDFVMNAEQRREAWANAGVLQDELSAPALVLNLRAAGDGHTARAMRLHAGEGEPYRLSVRQLLRCRPTFTPEVTGPLVFACENPTIVAAAANRLGAHSAPLVCVEGNPRLGARILLARLRDAGIGIAYHGDFDWPGLQIGNRLIGQLGASPWRFDLPHYLAAVSVGAQLQGDPVDAIWDRELRPAMIHARTAVHEERVVDDLCRDLADAAR